MTALAQLTAEAAEAFGVDAPTHRPESATCGKFYHDVLKPGKEDNLPSKPDAVEGH